MAFLVTGKKSLGNRFSRIGIAHKNEIRSKNNVIYFNFQQTEIKLVRIWGPMDTKSDSNFLKKLQKTVPYRSLCSLRPLTKLVKGLKVRCAQARGLNVILPPCF